MQTSVVNTEERHFQESNVSIGTNSQVKEVNILMIHGLVLSKWYQSLPLILVIVMYATTSSIAPVVRTCAWLWWCNVGKDVDFSLLSIERPCLSTAPLNLRISRPAMFTLILYAFHEYRTNCTEVHAGQVSSWLWAAKKMYGNGPRASPQSVFILFALRSFKASNSRPGIRCRDIGEADQNISKHYITSTVSYVTGVREFLTGGKWLTQTFPCSEGT